ncbi:Divergent protein kinase domain 2A like protein [Argiope bruennichi]|uniref:Divergent protein kinase domain 2A like protein n=1 Tax=Argiope bruennichi TaxID=94029 RepID=A0A8T0F5G2_ARGBR|nr:Divergent protein kinase domain 2A like protein [Argiope bruennichi]
MVKSGPGWFALLLSDFLLGHCLSDKIQDFIASVGIGPVPPKGVVSIQISADDDLFLRQAGNDLLDFFESCVDILCWTELNALAIPSGCLYRCHLDNKGKCPDQNSNPSSEEFTNVDLCPACYGRDLCPQFFHGDISLLGISKLRYLKSSKNVFLGKLSNNRVVLKKLAHDSEIANMDKLLCDKANLSPCDVKDAVKILIHKHLEIPDSFHFKNLIKTLDSSTDITRCPSERLITYLQDQLNMKRKLIDFEDVGSHGLGELMYGLLLNPEGIILQAFSQAEGWPFPQYLGSCGRVIVEEYVGKTISYYEDSPWKQRVDIAYQLLLIAQMLTENDSGFSLYMTDVNMDNFAVRSDGTVLLVDVESVVIVDRFNLKKDQNFLNKRHHSKGQFCKDCLNFSFDDLCNHSQSDHNYYAICKGLLVPESYYSPKGEDRQSREETLKDRTELEDRPNSFLPSPEFSYTRPTGKLLTYDGQTSWTVFETQFDVVSSTNGWTDVVKASQLVASFRGSAVDVLQGIPSEKLTDLMTIEKAMESRFGTAI